MDLLSLMKERYSVRKFEERPVEKATIERIPAAGMLAPTAKNLQPQRILVLDEKERLEALDRCTACRFGAPAVFVVCYDADACWKRGRYDGKPSGETDAAIVTTHMMLEAAALGIGTTWVMHFDPAALRREFSLPASYEPVALLVAGYPAPDAQPSPMHEASLPESDLVFFDRFPEK